MAALQTRQQRRAADRRGQSQQDFEPLLRILFGLVLVVVLAGFGWWYWSGTAGWGTVRDGAPQWSPDSRRVIFYSETDGKADLFTIDVNGTNRQLVTGAPSDEGAPAFSPDGLSVAFDTDLDGNFEIYVAQVNGEGWRRLTNHPGRDVAPAWSPDGNWIAFMSTRSNPEFDIYRMDKDGGNLEQLTHGGSNWFPQYSPDGNQIAMHVMRDVHILDLRTRELRRVTYEPLNGMHPTWSPDGKQLAFMSWRNGRTEIFTAGVDGSNQQMIVSMPTGDAVDPRWSPNGKYIAFVHVPSGGLGAAQSETDERAVYVVDLSTRKLTRLSR